MSKLRTHLAPGKSVRLGRIFGSDGRTVIVAFDHGVTGVNTLGGLTRPDELIRDVSPHADCFLVSAGIARGFAGTFGRTGVIVRVDGGPTSATGDYDRIRPMLTVEDALRLGADGVAAMGLIGTKNEHRSLRDLSMLAAECERLGMPLLAEMMPGGIKAENVDVKQIAVAARVGAELGADIIKVRYEGPASVFRSVTEDCFRPVVVLGGARKAANDFVPMLSEAMHAGAAGVAIGRNVWSDPRPGEMARRLRDIVHGPNAA